MRSPFRQIQPVLAYAASHLEDNISLDALAARAGLSPYHLHRVFSAVTGETPKRLTLRLRLEVAATLLLRGGDSVLDVAVACGFQSHEVFCRAFRHRYGMAPTFYRRRGLVNGGEGIAGRHSALVGRIGPCVGLYHATEERKSRNMTYSITRRELSPQPVLVVRRRIERSAIAATIGETLPLVFLHAQKNGIALAGMPFTRYLQVGPGLITIEPGMRIAGFDQNSMPMPVNQEWTQNAVLGQVEEGLLPGGFVAMTTHAGPYDKLPDAYAAIEAWIEAEGLSSSGAPWEVYVTSPTEHADPSDWKTEVFWPLT